MTNRSMNTRRYTARDVLNAWKYLKYGTFPKGLSPAAKTRFKKRYGSGRYIAGKKPGNLTFDGKMVVPKELIGKVLTAAFNNVKFGRSGIHSFYSRVSSRFEGISRNAIKDFLESHKIYQVHQAPPKANVQPIKTTKPLQMVQIDFIDMGGKNKAMLHANRNRRYILTVVDHFSRFMWAYTTPKRIQKTKKTKNTKKSTNRGRKKKREGDNKDKQGIRNVLDALKAIFKDMTPKMIKADNEFRAKEILEWAEKNGIKWVNAPAYQPNVQGSVERHNRTLKSLIYRHLSVYDTQNWVDALPDLLFNHNHTKHSATGRTPYELMFDASKDDLKEVNERLKKYRARMVRGTRKPYRRGDDRRYPKPNEDYDVLKKGDKVRVALSVLASHRKANMQKRALYKPQWSSEIYEVESIYRPKSKERLMEYGVTGWSGRFRRSMLQKISGKTNNDYVPPKQSK